jgi:SAM-dependent methyltransferase
MKSGEPNPDKQLYCRLRALSWPQLWTAETPRFNAADPNQRRQSVALIRAVGVVFSESGPAEHKDAVRRWLLGLLHDPCEIIQRYAMNALPKIGAGPGEEAELLSLFRSTTLEREQKYLARSLEKIGGAATLHSIQQGSPPFLSQAEQKVKASVARAQSPSALRMRRLLSDFAGLRIHLRGRRGLEGFVRREAEESVSARGKFRVADVRPGLVSLTPLAPFALADIYALRCFGTVGFVPGPFEPPRPSSPPHPPRAEDPVAALAAAIASPSSRRVFQAFTDGTIRYRLNFVSRGHQRSLVRRLAGRVFALCPEILNDARNVTWTIDIQPGGRGHALELRPNLTPDPRFLYRRQDVPAASHPPLAACLARLAGRAGHEIVWDPFCGSGSELMERVLLGGVRAIYGSDRDPAAIAIARANFAALRAKSVNTTFVRSDFRDFPAAGALGSDLLTLIITNPPMGRRVPLADVRRLMEDLFRVAAAVLQPGGRLVLANPLPMDNPHPALKLQSRQPVDFGGFDCRLELYRKLPR